MQSLGRGGVSYEGGGEAGEASGSKGGGQHQPQGASRSPAPGLLSRLLGEKGTVGRAQFRAAGLGKVSLVFGLLILEYLQNNLFQDNFKLEVLKGQCKEPLCPF